MSKRRRIMLRAELEQATRELDVSRSLITEALGPRDEFSLSPERLSIFASRVRDLLLGDNKGATKVYLSTIVSKVEVGDRFIRVVGEWGDIWAAAWDMDPSEGSAVPIHPGVQRFVRRWRKGRDSNPRCGSPHASFQDWSLKPLGHPSNRLAPNSAYISGKCRKNAETYDFPKAFPFCFKSLRQYRF